MEYEKENVLIDKIFKMKKELNELCNDYGEQQLHYFFIIDKKVRPILKTHLVKFPIGNKKNRQMIFGIDCMFVDTSQLQGQIITIAKRRFGW